MRWISTLLVVTLAHQIACDIEWTSGHQYVYIYNGTLSTKVQEHTASVQITGKMLITPRNREQAIMQLSNVEIKESMPGGDPNRAMLPTTHQIHAPFLVTFKSGLVISIQTSANTSSWMTNFVKGLASMFQVNVRGIDIHNPNTNSNRDELFFNVNEDGIDGVCNTFYSISQPFGLPDSHLQVLKTIDMDNCLYSSRGHVAQGFSDSRYVMMGRYEELQLLSVVHESRTQVKEHIFTSSIQSLIFESKEQNSFVTEIQEPSHVLSGLSFTLPLEDNMNEVEVLKRYQQGNSTLKSAIEVADDILALGYEFDNNDVTERTLNAMTSLRDRFESLRPKEMSQIYEKIIGTDLSHTTPICIFFNLLSGTKAGESFVVNEKNAYRIDIDMFRCSSPSYASMFILLRFLQEKETWDESLWKEVMETVTETLDYLDELHKNRNEEVSTSLNNIKVIEQLSDYLIGVILQSNRTWQTDGALQVLTHVRHPRVLQVLKPYIWGAEQSTPQYRIELIKAAVEAGKNYNTELLDILLPVFLNFEEHEEVRGTAAVAILSSEPAVPIFNFLASTASSEQSDLIYDVVYSALEKLSTSSNILVADNAAAALHLVSSSMHRRGGVDIESYMKVLEKTTTEKQMHQDFWINQQLSVLMKTLSGVKSLSTAPTVLKKLAKQALYALRNGNVSRNHLASCGDRSTIFASGLGLPILVQQRCNTLTILRATVNKERILNISVQKGIFLGNHDLSSTLICPFCMKQFLKTGIKSSIKVRLPGDVTVRADGSSVAVTSSVRTSATQVPIVEAKSNIYTQQTNKADGKEDEIKIMLNNHITMRHAPLNVLNSGLELQLIMSSDGFMPELDWSSVMASVSTWQQLQRDNTLQEVRLLKMPEDLHLRFGVDFGNESLISSSSESPSIKYLHSMHPPWNQDHSGNLLLGRLEVEDGSIVSRSECFARWHNYKQQAGLEVGIWTNDRSIPIMISRGTFEYLSLDEVWSASDAIALDISASLKFSLFLSLPNTNSFRISALSTFSRSDDQQIYAETSTEAKACAKDVLKGRSSSYNCLLTLLQSLTYDRMEVSFNLAANELSLNVPLRRMVDHLIYLLYPYITSSLFTISNAIDTLTISRNSFKSTWDLELKGRASAINFSDVPWQVLSGALVPWNVTLSEELFRNMNILGLEALPSYCQVQSNSITTFVGHSIPLEYLEFGCRVTVLKDCGGLWKVEVTKTPSGLEALITVGSHLIRIIPMTGWVSVVANEQLLPRHRGRATVHSSGAAVSVEKVNQGKVKIDSSDHRFQFRYEDSLLQMNVEEIEGSSVCGLCQERQDDKMCERGYELVQKWVDSLNLCQQRSTNQLKCLKYRSTAEVFEELTIDDDEVMVVDLPTGSSSDVGCDYRSWSRRVKTPKGLVCISERVPDCPNHCIASKDVYKRVRFHCLTDTPKSRHLQELTENPRINMFFPRNPNAKFGLWLPYKCIPRRSFHHR